MFQWSCAGATYMIISFKIMPSVYVNYTFLIAELFVTIGTIFLFKFNLKNTKVRDAKKLSERYQRRENIRVLRAIIYFSIITSAYHLVIIIISEYASRVLIPINDIIQLAYCNEILSATAAGFCAIYTLPFLLHQKGVFKNKSQ